MIMAFRILLLATIWWVCSGIAEPFYVFLGVLSLLGVFLLSRRMQLFKDFSLLSSPLETIQYLGWLLKEIYLSSISVTKLIWQVQPRPEPVLGWIETDMDQESAVAVYGNSITLTPGTITVETAQEKKRTLVLVHALQKSGFDDIASGRMARRVKRIFRSKGKKAGNTWW